MSADGTFNTHIEGVIKKVRQKIGWVCQTFKYRSMEFMRHMYVSLIRPHLDYCSQLWAPSEGVLMDRLERVQRNYLLLVPELRNMKYTDQLRMMNIQSLERRYDRYHVIYVRKALLGLVPRMGLIEEHDRDHRLGLRLKVPRTTNKLREESFVVRGPEAFNCLPKDLRNEIGSMDTFKKKLDEFLFLIPDIPRIAVGSYIHLNSLKNQIKGWTWQMRM